MASVGVWTRPTLARFLPFEPYMRLVIARVPLMPTSQSDSLRQRAASCSDCISDWSFRLANVSRMDEGVMDETQSLCRGSLHFRIS